MSSALLESHLPERGVAYRIVHRIAGLGSLGRRRRGVDELARRFRRSRSQRTSDFGLPLSASGPGRHRFFTRPSWPSDAGPDPFVDLRGNWLIRRLAPDCSRIELASLPDEPDESKLLDAMGWETANIHLGDPRAAAAIRDDLKNRSGKWLAKAAHAMTEAVLDDWKQWKA